MGKKQRITPLIDWLLKRRQDIESVMGHMKADHRLRRNFLLGRLGDRINAFLSGCAFNLRKITNMQSPGEVKMAV
jgi:transposase, IS5 family